MATVTHTIYSHYDPQHREIRDHEAGPIQTQDTEDPWQTESSFASSRLAAAPQFVPATIPLDEWGSVVKNSTQLLPEAVQAGNGLAGWYRSLTNGGDPSTMDTNFTGDPPVLPEKERRILEKRNKNNWFIMKAIQSESRPTSFSPSSTLADILARDPPPLPTESKYTPPVWLTLGPSNKGFAMLQRSGWSEGEALGPNVIRRDKPAIPFIPDREMLSIKGKGRAANPRGKVKQEERDVECRVDGDISEVRKVEVIDLTHSDSDADSDEPDPEFVNATIKTDITRTLSSDPPPHKPTSPHDPKALLTPIATVLKSDRLGIGLKAKTMGPYKASQKRVTHNAAAMAAHIKGAEELRRRKKEVGRGRRGFERLKKQEEDNRKKLLAYLNE